MDSELTIQDREHIQDWLARRFLQLHYPLVGRRRYDRKLHDFRGDIKRYIQWQLEQEPWRISDWKRRGRLT